MSLLLLLLYPGICPSCCSCRTGHNEAMTPRSCSCGHNEAMTPRSCSCSCGHNEATTPPCCSCSCGHNGEQTPQSGMQRRSRTGNRHLSPACSRRSVIAS